MANETRKGNRSGVPSRGGRRSNTPPPPTVRLGLDGNPELEPISTSRPRGNELPKPTPVLENLPVAVSDERVADERGLERPAAVAKAAESAVVKAPDAAALQTVEAPPKVEAPAIAEPVVAAPPAIEEAPTQALAVAEASTAGTQGLGDEGGRPSLLPRRSVAPGNRKRGSNLRGASTGRSIPPPPAVPNTTASSPPPAVPGDEASTAKAPPVVRAAEPAELVPQADAAAPTPIAAPAPDLDEGFFDHGERAGADAHHDASDLEHYDEKMAQKNTPEARARRAQNSRYVLFAGAACVLVLLVADVMHRRGHNDAPASDAPGTSAAATREPTPVPVNVPPASSADEAVAAPAGSASAPAVASGAPSAALGAPADSSKAWVATSASAGPAGAPPPSGAAGAVANGGANAAPSAGASAGAVAGSAGSSAVPGAEPTADDKKSAAQEKRACQSLLDQGAFAKAVEAGEHSVALDPADGEAWLLLGAAYQSMGKGAEARRSFTSCVAEAKRGPVNDCRAMLR